MRTKYLANYFKYASVLSVEDDKIIEALTEGLCSEIPFEGLKIPRFRSKKRKPKVVRSEPKTNSVETITVVVDQPALAD